MSCGLIADNASEQEIRKKCLTSDGSSATATATGAEMTNDIGAVPKQRQQCEAIVAFVWGSVESKLRFSKDLCRVL